MRSAISRLSVFVPGGRPELSSSSSESVGMTDGSDPSLCKPIDCAMRSAAPM